jgi:hypothetical protein
MYLNKHLHYVSRSSGKIWEVLATLGRGLSKYRQLTQERKSLKVPKREIFHRSDFPDFYIIKSSWVGDLVVKILTYYFNF